MGNDYPLQLVLHADQGLPDADPSTNIAVKLDVLRSGRRLTVEVIPGERK